MTNDLQNFPQTISRTRAVSPTWAGKSLVGSLLRLNVSAATRNALSPNYISTAFMVEILFAEYP